MLSISYAKARWSGDRAIERAAASHYVSFLCENWSFEKENGQNSRRINKVQAGGRDWVWVWGLRLGWVRAEIVAVASSHDNEAKRHAT